MSISVFLVPVLWGLIIGVYSNSIQIGKPALCLIFFFRLHENAPFTLHMDGKPDEGFIGSCYAITPVIRSAVSTGNGYAWALYVSRIY